MLDRLQRYFIPGLVIQSVLVGATYATGREVTEFFLRFGPSSALLGLLTATALYSIVCIVIFELARRYQVLDYRQFCKVYLGRFWFLFEIGFLFGVILTLSVVAAATGTILADLVGLPMTLSAIGMMVLITLLVSMGQERLEKAMSLWSIFFYGSYVALVVVTFTKFGDRLTDQFALALVESSVIPSAVIYTAFSSAILPTLVFVARRFTSSRDAVVAGSLCGPLVILPGLALVLMLSPFFPTVVEEPIPIMLVFEGIGNDALSTTVQIAMLGTFAATGAGLLHGINERIANAMAEDGKAMPLYVRTVIALAAMTFSVFLAARFGIIDLVAKGFRIGAAAFVAVILVPLITRGFWLIMPARKGKERLTGA
jgi:uncharacterized membrane protein YkvI